MSDIDKELHLVWSTDQPDSRSTNQQEVLSGLQEKTE